MRVGQSTVMLNVPALSQASQLPHGFWGVVEIGFSNPNLLICNAAVITAYRQPSALLKCAASSVRRLHCAIYLG